LGRADNLSAFVRHGKDSAYTEIELYFENEQEQDDPP
jgi:hypothetical protein